MTKMTSDCRIFQKLLEKRVVAKITLRHKADGPPLVRMRKERKETWLEMMNMRLILDKYTIISFIVYCLQNEQTHLLFLLCPF